MKKDILVIGESCRDIFVYCDTTRLAPDYPVPVLSVINQTENAGMARNVQRNIQVYKQCEIYTNINWQSVTKTRYVHNKTNHMFFRVDSAQQIDEAVIENIDLDYKLVVISDYNKGFLTKETIEKICNNHNNVFLDTKKVLGEWANKAKFIKINDYEYQNSKQFLNKNLIDKIIHTMGGDGCEYQNKKYPVSKSEVKDTSGAGDSFLAALVINYFDTQNIEESIKFANKCASEVVKHRGVTTII